MAMIHPKFEYNKNLKYSNDFDMITFLYKSCDFNNSPKIQYFDVSVQ